MIGTHTLSRLYRTIAVAVVTSSPAANGFDWSDAGIGAAITAGLMLILIGATRLLSNRRSAVAV